jgi:hypothetical protein
LREIAQACAERNNHHVLIDTRDAGRSNLSVTDVWQLAADLGDLGFENQIRVAFVDAPKDPFDRGAFFETCAQNRGYTIRAFRDFEKALYWLASDEAEDTGK